MITITPPLKKSIATSIEDFGRSPFFWSWIGEGVLGPPVSGGSKVDIQERVKRLSFELRQAYIDYVGAISKDQPPDWWRTSVSEKNPYISNTFFFACCIKACLEEIRGHREGSNFLFVVQDPGLRQALSANLRTSGFEVRLVAPGVHRLRIAARRWAGVVAHQGYFIFRNAARVACARYWHRLHATKPLQALKASGVPLCVTNIWVDRRAYSPETGEFRDVDFSVVSEFLRSRGKTVVGLANILNSASYARVTGYIAGSEAAFLVPHSFLKMRDILACGWRSLLSRPGRRKYAMFAEMEISPLVVQDLEEEWFRQREAEHVLIERWIGRLKQAGLQVERFIYTFENHTWERVACHALRSEYPSVKLIGYQPNGLPLLLLNHFISKAELGSIPLPDRIVANGDYPARLLAESGFGWDRVKIGGGLRQAYLQQTLYGGRVETAQSSGRAEVLVTPSIGRYRTIELLHKVIEAFRRAPEVPVILKCHPSMRFEELKSFLGPVRMPDSIRISTQAISGLLPDATVLVYNDGTFPAAEALSFGLPVVFVEPEYGLPLDSLDGFPFIRYTARTPEDIWNAVRTCLKSADLERHKADALLVVRQLVGEVNDQTYGLFDD